MPVIRSRTFRSGNSEALRLPKDVAFGTDVELVLHRRALERGAELRPRRA